MNNFITKLIGLSVIFSFLAITLSLSGCSSGKSTTESVSLEGTRWILETLNGKSIPITNGNNATLKFDEATGKISGSGSCNTFFGSYKADGSVLKFSEIGSTKMMCDEMSVETDYFSALQKTDKYEIKSGKLNLYSSSSVIMVFKKK
jgi:heat shock protein HslJ